MFVVNLRFLKDFHCSEVKNLLRRNKDDSMRQFLIAAVQYLTQLPETMTEIPIDIIRPLKNIEIFEKQTATFECEINKPNQTGRLIGWLTRDRWINK